ncbi:MAG: hypothetical protein IJS45_00715 [Clostridia bacterium]|nr:hypothetical protein [Clostridia bacterium]
MLVIGLDVGTTGTKALVVDETGRTVAGAYREYQLKSDGAKVSQNAEDWWDAVKYTVSTVSKGLSGEIKAISLSTQGASMLAADEEGNPVSEVITWMDSRAAEEVKYLDGAIGTETVYKKCGWPLSPAGDAAKLLWLKNNDPDTFNSAKCFPSTIEYINKKLTGRFVTDPTNAAIRQLFNITTGDWDDEILSAVGVTRDRLPECAKVGEAIGHLTAEAASALGLSTDVAVYCGAHDQYAASLGSGATSAGDMMLATGTAWVVLGVTDRLLYTKNHICPGIHPAGKFGAMASLVSAGSALKWFRDLTDDDYKELDGTAAKRIASAKDIFVLPYVAGAGFPHDRPDAGGVIYGFRVGSDRYDVARAVMEGVAFEARSVLEEFSRAGMKIDRLMMTGGAAKSDVWTKIVGNITGCTILRPTERETCCLGAAETAFVGAGVYPDYDACRRVMVKTEPLGENAGDEIVFYNEKYERYKEIRRRVLGI